MREKEEAKMQKTIAQKNEETAALVAEEVRIVVCRYLVRIESARPVCHTIHCSQEKEIKRQTKVKKLQAAWKRKREQKAAAEEQPMTRELRTILEALVT